MAISATSIASSSTLNTLRTEFNNLVTDVTALESGTISYTTLNTTTLNSTTINVKEDFQEYVFTAGVKDDGIGTSLDDFIQFQIKIVMQGTDASKPVRIKDLRAIALST